MNLFKKETVAAAPEPKALPRDDDEQARAARLREYSKLQRSSGRESTRLGQPAGTERTLGEYAPAQTRGAAILGG